MQNPSLIYYMAIGRNKIDLQIKRAIISLNEVVAWVKTFDSTTKEQILNWIRKDQLFNKGVDKFGEVIGFYSLSTEFISGGKKKFNTHYTLFDSGDFYRSMFISVGLEAIKIDADAQKGNENLFDKFGTGIIGLTDENFEKLKNIFQESYIKYAKEVLQIN